MRYDGYMWQQVNGTAIAMQSGNIRISGGRLIGRGYREMNLGFEEGGTVKFTAWVSGCVEAYAGKLVINDGEFLAKGNAAPILAYRGNSAEVIVNGGYFDISRLKYVQFPNIGGRLAQNSLLPVVIKEGNVPDFMKVDDYDYYHGLSEKMYDPERVILEKEKVSVEHNAYGQEVATYYNITVQPRQDLPMSVKNLTEKKAVENGETIFWDGSSSLSLQAAFPDYYPYFNYAKHRGFLYLQSTAKTGTSPAVIIGGKEYYEGGEENIAPVEKRIINWDDDILARNEDGNHTFSVDIREFAPKNLEDGGVFQLHIRAAEINPRYEEDTLGSRYGAFYHSVYIQKAGDFPVVTDHPTTQVAEKQGESVTLTAKAEGAESAHWEMVYPDQKTFENDKSFDGETSSFTVPVMANQRFRCVFENGHGKAYSNAAGVYYKPTLEDNAWTAVGVFEGADEVRLTAAANIDGIPYTSVEWLKGGERLTADRYVIDRNTLTIKNPTTGDSGEYTCRIGYKESWSAEWEKANYLFSLQVWESDPDQQITEAELYGIGELYLGDTVPEEVFCQDSRIGSAKLSWPYNYYDKVLTSPNPTYKLELTAADGYVFRLDESGNFSYIMDGVRYTVWIGEAGETRKTLSITYTYDQNHALTAAPADSFRIEGTELDVIPGEEVYLPFSFELICPERHDEKHRFTGEPYFEENQPLPEGLSLLDVTLSEDGSYGQGAISGTLSESVPAGLYTSALRFPNTGENSPSTGVFYFQVLAPIQRYTGSLPKLHTHSFTEQEDGGWVSEGENTHARTCSSCGLKETQEHQFDEGVTILPEKQGEDGRIVYTCKTCGYQDTVTLKASALADAKFLYTISFDANGGEGELAPLKLYEGEELSLPSCSFTAPEGYVFSHWESYDDDLKHMPGELVSVAGNMTFTAIWVPESQAAIVYQVSFDANKGTGTMPNIAVKTGGKLILPQCGFTAPEGMVFSSWELLGTLYQPGQKAEISSDAVVVAIWKPKENAEDGEKGFQVKGLKAEYTYTGAAIKPEISLYYGNLLLTPGKDYAVSFSNNVNVTEEKKPAKLNITLKGSYSGKLPESTFAITDVKMDAASLADGTFLVQSAPIQIKENAKGSVVQKIKPVVYFQGKKLSGSSYQVEYPSKEEGAYADAGKWPITITPNPRNANFTGEGFTVYEYIEPKGGINLGAGSVSIILSKGSVSFKGGLPTYQVNYRKDKKSEPTVLKEGTHYSAEFLNEKKVGTATLQITALPGSGYYGTKSKTFKITKENLTALNESDYKITIAGGQTVYYEKGGVKPKVELSIDKGSGSFTLTEGVDFKVSYSNHTAAERTGRVKLSGIGNYSGSLTAEFKIEKAKLSTLKQSFFIANWDCAKKKGYEKTKVFFRDANGKDLALKSDYTLSFTPVVADGEDPDYPKPGTLVNVTVSAGSNNNYQGSFTDSFLIVDPAADHSVNKCRIRWVEDDGNGGKKTKKSFLYEGEPVVPGYADFDLVYGSGKNEKIIDPSCYTIVTCYNNTAKGTGKLVLAGVGEYGGLATFSFTITAKAAAK